MAFLYIIFFFIIILLLSGIGIIGGILRMIFGGRRNSAQQQNNTGNKSTSRWYTYGQKREKVFDKNDGEYVEFEEIKENKTEK